MNSFCTISSQSHLFKAFALADSLLNHNVSLFVLLLDSKNKLNSTQNVEVPTNIHWISLDELNSLQVAQLRKKFGENSDEFRWGLKPVFLNFLCQKIDQVCYVDNDIFFLNNPSTIFEKFETHKILLTPHFYPNLPNIKGANWFEANFQVGVYNAGFIGVRNDATDFLTWWFEACIYGIRKSYFRGLFDDQKYLDLVPAIFQPVYVHPMPTWNYAAWNSWYPLIKCVNGKLLIGDEPIVFVHFATLSLQEFRKESHVANEIYCQYMDVLAKFATDVNPEEPIFTQRKIKNYLRYMYWRILKYIQN